LSNIFIKVDNIVPCFNGIDMNYKGIKLPEIYKMKV
jgi:hypothetical protein